MEILILTLALLVSTVALVMSLYNRIDDWRVKLRAVYEDMGDGSIMLKVVNRGRVPVSIEWIRITLKSVGETWSAQKDVRLDPREQAVLFEEIGNGGVGYMDDVAAVKVETACGHVKKAVLDKENRQFRTQIGDKVAYVTDDGKVTPV